MVCFLLEFVLQRLHVFFFLLLQNLSFVLFFSLLLLCGSFLLFYKFFLPDPHLFLKSISLFQRSFNWMTLGFEMSLGWWASTALLSTSVLKLWRKDWCHVIVLDWALIVSIICGDLRLAWHASLEVVQLLLGRNSKWVSGWGGVLNEVDDWAAAHGSLSPVEKVQGFRNLFYCSLSNSMWGFSGSGLFNWFGQWASGCDHWGWVMNFAYLLHAALAWASPCFLMLDELLNFLSWYFREADLLSELFPCRWLDQIKGLLALSLFHELLFIPLLVFFVCDFWFLGSDGRLVNLSDWCIILLLLVQKFLCKSWLLLSHLFFFSQEFKCSLVELFETVLALSLLTEHFRRWNLIWFKLWLGHCSVNGLLGWGLFHSALEWSWCLTCNLLLAEQSFIKELLRIEPTWGWD